MINYESNFVKACILTGLDYKTINAILATYHALEKGVNE